MISSRADRDVLSETGEDRLRINFKSGGGVESPNSNAESSFQSRGEKLKSIQGGLVSIQEDIEQPEIKIQLLGEQSPNFASSRRRFTLSSVHSPDSNQQTNELKIADVAIGERDMSANTSPVSTHPLLNNFYAQILQAISVSTVPKKKTGKKKKIVKEDVEEDDTDENPFQQDTRQLLSYQLFAQDFFRRVVGNEADDPSKVAEMLGYEKITKVESQEPENNERIAKKIMQDSTSPLANFRLRQQEAQKAKKRALRD